MTGYLWHYARRIIMQVTEGNLSNSLPSWRVCRRKRAPVIIVKTYSISHFQFPLSIFHSPFPIPRFSKKNSISHFQFPIPHFPFPISHSPFPIPHSPFPIPHSPFPIPHSPFPIPHSPFPVLVTSFPSVKNKTRKQQKIEGVSSRVKF